MQHSGALLRARCSMASKPKRPRGGEGRRRRGRESPASRFPYLSTDRRDIVDLAAIEVKSDFPSPAFESSRRRFSSFAHGSLPTPPSPSSHNSPTTIFDLTKVGCSLSLARSRGSRSRNKKVNYSRETVIPERCKTRYK